MERKNGYIVIDDFKKINKRIVGNYVEGWYTDGNDEHIFKTGLTELERYKELYYPLIIKELGLESSDTDLARRKNTCGIISKNYNPNHNEAYTLEEIIKDYKNYNLKDLPYEISDFCTSKNWNYSLEMIKEKLLIKFIIQILLGDWDLSKRNIEISYDIEKETIKFSPFYDFTFYGIVGRYKLDAIHYAFQNQKYDDISKITPSITIKNFLNTANDNEMNLLKEYLEKLKRISLTKNIYLIEEKTEREVPMEIKNQLTDGTQKCFEEVEGYIRKRGLM